MVKENCPTCGTALKDDKVWNRNHIKSCRALAVNDVSSSEKQEVSEKLLEGTLPNGFKFVKERGQGKAKAKATLKHQHGWLDTIDTGCTSSANGVSDDYVWRRAARRSLSENTVSAFANEVFLTYQSQGASQEGRRNGEDSKASISAYRKIHPRNMLPGWHLFYENTDNPEDKVFPISCLRVNGHALQARPDLVFVSSDESEALIVQVKVYRGASIPRGGWPNVRAQLWAYSKIDEFRRFSRIRLVGEIWRREQLSTLGSEVPAIVHFEPNELNSIWSEIFVRMGGEIKHC